ncbi:phosphate propanoyltransferase [Fictibacillus aquaticus]|uniref:phosphate propanoyltransferase n=1 Tax=Fictibacillus aquaticus TaxID=2021314 RepID=UPI0035E962F2
MNKETVRSIVEKVVQELTFLTKEEKPTIPVAVSARHIHLSQQDVEVLFGTGYELTQKAELSQPGQFAANETVTIAGTKGSIRNVRVLGPARGRTQIEISQTDAISLGYRPPVRQSGDIRESSPCTVIGPKGALTIPEGLIIAQRHIHMTPADAEQLAVKDGDYVSVSIKSERPVTFEDVLIRVNERYKLEMHIDTDEANSALVQKGQTGKLVLKQEGGNHE